MKLFKTIGIAMLVLSMCTGCTSYTKNIESNQSETELKEKIFDINSTTKYKVADIEFDIPNYFKLDNDDSGIKLFFADNSELPIISLQEGKSTLNNDSIDEYINSFVNSSDGAFNNFTNFTSKAEVTKKSKINYYRVYDDSDIILKDNSKMYADVTFYFISNGKKDNFAVLMYIQYNGLKYDYEDSVYQIMQNVKLTDQIDNETTSPNSDSSLPSSSSSSTTPSTPNTNSNTNSNSSAPTTGQRNALNRALDYLDNFEFSRQGLIDQLLYDGYTQEEAEYGADHTNVNWNDEAMLKAADYLSVMSFSRQGLIEQLMFDGFTQEQAEYGVSQNGY